jgi:hypothetical protein
MLRTLSHLTLAAAFVLTAACESPTTIYTSAAEEPALEPNESIPGILEAANWLRSGETLYQLAGQTALFKELIGAEVLIDGYIDPADGALVVREFLVLAVEGVAAFDGTLIAESPGFLLRTRQRDLWLATVPPGLAEHVGKRIWLTTLAGVAVRYGVLE